jgi:hypothetical protein
VVSPAATKKAATERKRAAKQTPPLRIVTRTFKDGHTTHWYEVNGQSCAGRGVTTLLGNGLPAPALMKWAANEAASCALDERDIWEPLAQRDRSAAYDFIRQASDRARDTAALKGTDVHNLAEQLAGGAEVEVPEHLVAHVDSYLAFVEEWQPEFVMVEVVGANFTRDYYGKFDILARLKGWWPDRPDEPALVLLDIKTGEKGPYEKDALQLAAYAAFEQVAEPDEAGNCWELEPMPAVDGCAVLKVTADGYRLIPINDELRSRMFAQFLHVTRTAEFLGSSFKRDDGWAADAFDIARSGPFETF